ncbi:NFX1-type zinc finger-containing protein 1 [Arthroderma uncinatum]|uniref:NFX1-type zinc finger-containing protein 1 n=1 Tax=Arthroderma uncinatum TaxID=74035 RepID=UPI00144AE355|nr:NFX1-type zinc finger-containing protein 1 [Arthroderma uncinatum]KAF3484283.1 NFX1-type zinc finger-containing protein 1 [Arthroderma uncinatum]
MASSDPDNDRTARLSAFLNKVVHGQRMLSTARDGKLFIEALCAQADPAACAHKLLSSHSGLPALQESVRFDTSPSFLNENAVTLLQYLQSPSLKMIDSGSVLNQLLLSMVEPPFFWDACIKSFVGGLLNPGACHAFAWLLLQLTCLPGKKSSPYVAVANSQNILDSILTSPNGETRIIGQKIKHALPLDASELHDAEGSSPGGRHDNDHANHREILIMPTADELLSKDRPFFRTTDFIDDPELVSSRRDMHIDNQFRLLREDMLCEIRGELEILTGVKRGHHKGIVVDGLSLAGVEMGTERKRLPWCVVLKCNGELPQLKNLTKGKKKDFLKDNRHILRHGNMACLMIDNEPAAFPTIHRDEDGLADNPATITIQFPDDPRLSYALSKMKTAESVRLVQLDAAIFAFEPFLRRLQEMVELPLAEELLYWKEDKAIAGPSFQPTKVITALEKLSGKSVQDLLGLKKKVVLDNSQMVSLCTSLLQRVSLVQGPPGTGKSFVGALIAKALHDSTSQKILVVCFTNHALDQFLEDLMDIGIPQSSMVRLGGKSTDRTKPLMIREMASVKLGRTQWAQIDKLKQSLCHGEERLKDVFNRYRTANIQKKHLMEFLEFLSDDLPFYDAFTVPKTENDGMIRVGRAGKTMGPFYLLDRWIRGESNCGSLQHLLSKRAAAVWEMPPALRVSTVVRWQTAILDDLVMEIRDTGRQFNLDQAELDRVFRERDAGIIKTKRIIACTTNGAAKYSAEIQNAAPGVILVEEAGEILEAHILTSLGPHTEQLILIGDHKQLRPKCSYELSVDQGDGFDLNRSLFERLVLKGFPHVTLTQQHRMRPEISSMIRHLTYPDLTDADSTRNRTNIRGFCDNVIFVNHSQPEAELKSSKELRDGRATSKQNVFEAQMILKCVRYLAQQGYSSDKLVVITPYLGQLKLLREHLAKENDPILNDLDKFDLVRAGLLTDLSSKATKPSLRISTIDNYQGEESNIVLASMTRSNKSFDIGFMAAPERLNVLLSRARDGLIMIGNSETFMHARKGKDIWRKLFVHLKENDHIYEGFPVRCEKHPDRTALLCKAEDFEAECPDGGCKEPCGEMLKCGLHKCPSSCHQLFNHAKISCMAPLTQKCSNGHNQSWRCHQGAPPVCQKCERDRKDALKKAQKALDEKEKREEKNKRHLEEVAKVEEDIEQINQKMKEMRLDREQQAILLQKRQDLAAAKERANKKQTATHQADISNDENGSKPKNETLKISSKPSPAVKSSPNIPGKHLRVREHINSAVEHNKSPSKTEWQRQKDQENAKNPAIDKIMEMIGLEDVKSQVLKIKAKVETSLRQGTDLKKERLGLTLLGNPGTGKTTVARHYAKVLSSLKVLPGDGFIETTGSRLAHGGISEIKNHLQQLQNSDGGVYFIDEAYQLTEAHNHGGKPVLDFLLAEIENLTGLVVFVFAGYRKQMEKFFEHNPGLTSRIPYTLHFDDYTDAELLKMLQFQMNQFFKHGVDIEGGSDGLYMRVAVRRLGRGRGRDGFGNARALENIFSKIRERQAERLTNERKKGTRPDDYHISKEDLIGPDPSKVMLTCNSWDQLQQLTGLEAVKKSISIMIDLIQTNYARELDEKEIIDVSLNRVFLGSPGTGKTSVAKLYGQILADIGILSNGEVVVKNPSDFVGSHIGESEANTKAILATTVGKVLIIDEAYMLYPGSSGGGNKTDIFKTAVIDTIVAEVQSAPGDDRCVLLLGYEAQMLDMFQNVNPGLTRRFRLSDAFRFEDFSDSELQEILQLKLKKQDLGATQQAVSTAIEVLVRLRNGLNFGNGGDVESLISKAKVNYQARQSALPAADRSFDFLFEPQDFDPDFDRSSEAETNLQELFQGVIGCEEIIAKLDGFLKVAKGMRAQGLEPRGQIPMNFIFKGPPGTGKTTTARKFGQVYFDLGFLSQVEVIECSATDLIGEYVGHTGPKTVKQLERGLGKVLFIDEAYRLGQGRFAQEAIDELVDNITKPKFAGKLVIILAGYDNDMNNLLRVNQGLSSRFADEIFFPSLSPKHCLQLLEDMLKRSQITFPSIHDPTIYLSLEEQVAEISKLPGWGNARDVQTLAKTMVRAVYQSNVTKVDQLILPAEIARKCVRDMLVDRCKRAKVTPSSRQQYAGPAKSQDDSYSPPPVGIGASTTTKSEVPKPKEDEDADKSQPRVAIDDGRDIGVADDIWEQLQTDKKDAEFQAQKSKQDIRELEEAQRAAEEVEKEVEKVAAALREMKAKNDADILERLRLREEARIREMEAKAEAERIRRELERKRQEGERKRKMEELAQRKLREMGVCIAGFRWIKQSGGYRCTGGTHWVPDSRLN